MIFSGAFSGFEHLIIALCITFILHKLLNKGKKAKEQEARINRDPNALENWDDYLSKLCRITGKNAGELFTIAAKESGINLSEERINRDFRMLISEGELPNYVIMFLKKGQEKIDGINDGPTCKSQDIGMF